MMIDYPAMWSKLKTEILKSNMGYEEKLKITDIILEIEEEQLNAALGDSTVKED